MISANNKIANFLSLLAELTPTSTVWLKKSQRQLIYKKTLTTEINESTL
jgi:hypothetical protein